MIHCKLISWITWNHFNEIIWEIKLLPTMMLVVPSSCSFAARERRRNCGTGVHGIQYNYFMIHPVHWLEQSFYLAALLQGQGGPTAPSVPPVRASINGVELMMPIHVLILQDEAIASSTTYYVQYMYYCTHIWLKDEALLLTMVSYSKNEIKMKIESRKKKSCKWKLN